MLDHTDHQIGRLITSLKALDQWDNTLFVLLSDNGASQEGGQAGVLDEMKWFNGIRESADDAVERLDDIGGPDSHCNIPWGWAQAGNTPLKWYKQNTHGGGVRDPLIMHWPAGIKAGGETRDQFCHAIDVAPTILGALGIATPQVVAGVPQTPVHGVSLTPTFEDPAANLHRGAQYFEMLGHRGIWKDGWKAVTHHEAGMPFDDDKWELYHLDQDFSEHDDLAQAEPAKLKELVDLWWAEADKHGVLPLDDRGLLALFAASRRPGLPTARDRFIYHPPISHIVSDACAPVARGWRTEVVLTHPAGNGDGALIARGSLNSGFALFVKNGRLVFDYNDFHRHTRLEARTPLAPGEHTIALDVRRNADGSAEADLSVDGEAVAAGKIPRLLFIISSTGMDLGRSLSPVTDDYAAPFAYPGEIDRVVFELPGAGASRGEVKANVRAENARQ
jgi:Sulfatase